MTIDQPIATIAAAGIAAFGVVSAALINKFNWNPATSPNPNPNIGSRGRRSVLLVSIFLVVSVFMTFITMRGLLPLWHSEKVVTAAMAIQIGLNLMGAMFFWVSSASSVGYLAGYFIGYYGAKNMKKPNKAAHSNR